MIIRKYTEKDISEMVHIWNEVIEDGEAFPQEEFLDDKTGAEFFASQTYCGVADKDGQIVGLYILHPNNIGRCGTLQMQVMQWIQLAVESISVRNS